ncbi:hypothetical protein VDT1_3648 [Vibrio sp. 16]|nr:hypothetical protein VDT1_3648 [Vibrio sp. 16]
MNIILRVTAAFFAIFIYTHPVDNATLTSNSNVRVSDERIFSH